MKEQKAQVEAVRDLMSDQSWWTLAQIQMGLQVKHDILAALTGVSARVRDLRKPSYGGNTIMRRVAPGTRNVWQYRLA